MHTPDIIYVTSMPLGRGKKKIHNDVEVETTSCYQFYNTVTKVMLFVDAFTFEEAMNKFFGGMAKHRSSEGKCVKIPYKGSVHDTRIRFDARLAGLRGCHQRRGP